MLKLLQIEGRDKGKDDSEACDIWRERVLEIACMMHIHNPSMSERLHLQSMLPVSKGVPMP